MRQLKIDLSQLEIAFHNNSSETSFYLDLETGQVLFVGDEERRFLVRVYESYFDEQSQSVDRERAFEEQDIRDWQRQVVQEADQVKVGFGDRFISIPAEGSHEGYNDMVAFIATVRDQRLAERLERAINGRGVFRYFKDVLFDYPTTGWLESEEITLLELHS